MLIAQLTDLHIRPRGKAAYRVAETNMLVQRAFTALMALEPKPDAVMITGDLTDCGLVEEYQLFATMLRALPMPVYVVPGNHDRRGNFRLVLEHLPGVTSDPDFVQYTVDHGALRLIALDTLIEGDSAGALCSKRLSFLERALGERPDAPAIVFMHHPPFVCGIEHMDKIRLLDGAEEFESIVSRHRQVLRILCGHHHRPIETVIGGALCMIAPSVAHQVELDLRPGDREGFMMMEPPAFRLHLWRGGHLVSHMAYVERYPGPFPFVLDPDYPGSH